MVIRDLTLRSAASFGSFHLIRLLYDEYMFYLVEHRVAQATGETPIAVMGEVRVLYSLQSKPKGAAPQGTPVVHKPRCALSLFYNNYLLSCFECLAQGLSSWSIFPELVGFGFGVVEHHLGFGGLEKEGKDFPSSLPALTLELLTGQSPSKPSKNGLKVLSATESLYKLQHYVHRQPLSLFLR